MSRRRLSPVVAALGAIALGAALAPEGLAERPCVTVSAQVLYRAYGYDHIVHLANRCDAAQECDVSTNVNPEPIHVTVDPKGKRAVLTFRGSPARTFTPHVTCHGAD